MIISASRRTDIPAFYSKWLMGRLFAGYVDVANPFNPGQIRRVDLRREAIDAIIFWTRNPRPLFKYLDEIDNMKYNYYFLYTLTNYPGEFEPNLPTLQQASETLKRLSDRIGPERLIWRYDPIIYSSITDQDFHRRNVEQICRNLLGSTKKAIISFVDPYNKTKRRIQTLTEKANIKWHEKDDCRAQMIETAKSIKEITGSYNIDLQSCAEDIDLTESGISAGSCIDFEMINNLFGLNLKYKKDRYQRPKCMCGSSVDIGAYNTCGYRCIYCYATSSFERAARNLSQFDSESTCMYNGEKKAANESNH